MPPASDKFANGRAGALCVQGPGTTTPPRYNIPSSRFNPQISRGDSAVPLINNATYTSNRVKGITICTFEALFPFIPAVTPAAFWTSAFLSVSGDDSGSNYYQLTMFPDGDGSAGVNYGSCKFSTWAGSINFSPNGAAQIASQRIGGISIDPEHGTALAAPSAGALSNGGILGYAQSAITGASAVTSVSWQVSTGLAITPGVVAGGNPSYPYLASGLLQQGLDGIVTVTQSRYAATVLGSDGSIGSLTVSLGSTGAGESFTFNLMPLSIGKPSDLGLNYQTSQYALISSNGTSAPMSVANL